MCLMPIYDVYVQDVYVHVFDVYVYDVMYRVYMYMSILPCSVSAAYIHTGVRPPTGT